MKNIITTIRNTFLIVVVFVFILSTLFVGCIPIKTSLYIDINDYIETIDYGILSKEQIKTFDDILNAVQNEKLIITCPVYSPKERHQIATQLGMYFGATEEVEHLMLWNNNKGVAYLNLPLFKKLLNQKSIIDNEIDKEVSTLIEGSDECKLRQISNHIAKKIVYTDGYRETIDALNGKGVCISYAMLFYKMATRLGIQTYICYGYAGDGYHAWNAVKLNGEYVYYDITWYDDVVPDCKYIESEFSWDRNFQFNNEWATDLNESNS